MNSPTPTQPTGGEQARTEQVPIRWRSWITYCDDHDEQPESISLAFDDVCIAKAPADDWTVNLFPKIVTAMNSHATHLATIAEQQATIGRMREELDGKFPLDDDTKHILGFMAIDCRPYAEMLRKDGHDIPRKIEMEQAHALHWMLGYYLKHGAKWREEAGNHVKDHLARSALNPAGGQT